MNVDDLQHLAAPLGKMAAKIAGAHPAGKRASEVVMRRRRIAEEEKEKAGKGTKSKDPR
jgi:hypothetical protein